MLLACAVRALREGIAMIRPLSEQEAKTVIKEGRIGRLGCIYDDTPYVVPVNYIFDGTSIYIHSLGGCKIAALRANPRACLQVVRDAAFNRHAA